MNSNINDIDGENNIDNYLIDGFKHEPGVHCTSSAIRNIFEFHGFPMSEAMVFGLGSGLGLGFMKFKGIGSTIGGRQYKFEDNLCNLLNIHLNKFQTTNPEEGWHKLKSMLEKNIPAAINLDMAYLPYQELPGGFHFGQHAVVVCGYNPKNSTVLIADTQFPDIKEVTLNDLDAARNSKYDRWMDPRNFIYEFDFPDSLPDMKKVIPTAIRLNGKNLQQKGRMMRIFGITNGLVAISKFSKSLGSWLNLTQKELEDQGRNTSGFISDYGTGGGLFRYLYARFLQEAADIQNDDSLADIGKSYKDLGDKWEEVSKIIREMHQIPKGEISQAIETTRHNLVEIKSLELQNALKLQNYSG
ncbi:MAG: BtrH N-terminal domain-containing protein [Candidatus Hodarchaeota archaeon]